MDKFRGLYWFTYLFKNAATAKHIGRVMLNTLAMSGIGIAFSWLPMVFAIFLSEVKNPHVKRIVQTCTTVPNFISWVLVYAVAFAIFSSDGFVSSLMMQQGIWKADFRETYFAHGCTFSRRGCKKVILSISAGMVAKSSSVTTR